MAGVTYVFSPSQTTENDFSIRILTLVRHNGVLMSITATMALEVDAVVKGDVAVGAMHVLEPRRRRARAART